MREQDLINVCPVSGFQFPVSGSASHLLYPPPYVHRRDHCPQACYWKSAYILLYAKKNGPFALTHFCYKPWLFILNAILILTLITGPGVFFDLGGTKLVIF